MTPFDRVAAAVACALVLPIALYGVLWAADLIRSRCFGGRS